MMATLIDAHSTARVAVNQLSIDQKWGKRGKIYRKRNRQIDKQTYKQLDRLTNRQIVKQTDGQTDR
jgi:hypothetical protein